MCTGLTWPLHSFTLTSQLSVYLSTVWHSVRDIICISFTQGPVGISKLDTASWLKRTPSAHPPPCPLTFCHHLSLSRSFHFPKWYDEVAAAVRISTPMQMMNNLNPRPPQTPPFVQSQPLSLSISLSLSENTHTHTHTHECLQSPS